MTKQGAAANDVRDSVLESATRLLRRGFGVVPVAHKSKVPTDPHTNRPIEKWQLLRITESDLGKWFNGKPQNVGMVCGEPSGNLIDIDLDCTEAVELGQHFLPATRAIFGRAGRLRSHWLYVVELQTKKYTDVDGKMLLELRGTGCQTVAPGSTHESGEAIDWSPGYDQHPGKVTPEDLRLAVSRLAAATILSRHFPSKGSRHNFCLSLAGGLLRAGWSQKDAGAFVVAVATAGGSDEPEKHRAVAKDSAAKLAADKNVSGWPSLAEIVGAKVVARAREWLGCKSTGREEADDTWEAPVPFDDATQLPPFPLHVLPPVMREWVEAEAEATQTPPDLSACIALAVVSACVQKKFEVEVRPGWSEPLSTYWTIALPPADRKSKVFRDATAPIREWERLQSERMRATIAAAATKRAIQEKKHTEAVGKAAKGDDAAGDRAAELAVELAESRMPVVPRICCDDTTPERLNSLLAEHGGRMAVMSAEGGIFETVAGRYSDNVSNLDGLLKGHAGDEVKVDRMNRESLHIRRPAVTLGLCVQPSVIEGLAEKSGFRGRGFLARFLFIMPQSRVGHRNVTPPSVPAAVTAGWRELVMRLLELPEVRADDGEIESETLTLGRVARLEIEELARQLEPRLGPDGDLDSVRDWAGKSVGAVVRVIGLLHLAANSVYSVDSVGVISISHGGGSVEIRGETSELHTYLLSHSLRAFRSMGADPTLQAAKKLWGWASKLERFTKREAQVGNRATFKKASDLDAPLQVLVEHGFIRPRKQAERTGAGQPPSPSFETNPAAQNAQNAQNRGRRAQPTVNAAEPSVPPPPPTAAQNRGGNAQNGIRAVSDPPAPEESEQPEFEWCQ